MMASSIHFKGKVSNALCVFSMERRRRRRGFAEEALPMTAPGKEIYCEKWVATNGCRHDEDNNRKPSPNFLEVFVGDFFPNCLLLPLRQ
jgi:hypothetical protein